MSDEEKDSNKSWYDRNKEKVKRRRRLARQANQALKEHVAVGKLKAIELPVNTVAILQDKFRVDETSKTGLRWSESTSANKPCLRGKEAGTKSKTGYYVIQIQIGSVKYLTGVSRIIMMITNNKIIEPGMVINHINRKRDDNRIANLEVTTRGLNRVNCAKHCSSFYKNVIFSRSNCSRNAPFAASFQFLKVTYRSKYTTSEDHAVILGWELMTSGEVPLGYIKAQSDEWKDGPYLQRALAECKKQGIAVTPPKYKTLYEYIASVEGSC